MSEWDTNALLTDIRERGSLPANDVRFTSASLLAAATRELREGCAPLLTQSRVEHLVYPYSQPVVAGQNSYRMPPRAVGGTLRDVAFLQPGNAARRLRPMSADQIEQIGRVENSGTPYAYWIQSYRLILVGVPNINGTLSTPYYARPNALVLPSACIDMQDINHTGLAYVVTAPGTPPAGLAADCTIDIVRGTPGFETLTVAASCIVQADTPSPGTTTYAFTADSQDIANGDYLCLAGQAPVPQLPVEMFGLLAARTARRLIKAVGDDRWQALEADVQELEDMAKNWLSQRVSGDTEQAGGDIANNGILGGLGYGWSGWY